MRHAQQVRRPFRYVCGPASVGELPERQIDEPEVRREGHADFDCGIGLAELGSGRNSVPRAALEAAPSGALAALPPHSPTAARRCARAQLGPAAPPDPMGWAGQLSTPSSTRASSAWPTPTDAGTRTQRGHLHALKQGGAPGDVRPLTLLQAAYLPDLGSGPHKALGALVGGLD